MKPNRGQVKLWPRPQDNLNRVKMNPQPLLDSIHEVCADSHNRCGRFVRGKGMAEPFFNQPQSAVGVCVENGVWFWLIDN